MSLEAISKLRQDMATGASAFAEDVDVSTPGKAVAFLPIGIAYFLLSPFPWQITSPLEVLSLPEMLLIYGLVPAMIRGVRHIVRVQFRESLQMLLLTSLLTISYALGEGNVGTLYRHRAQAIGFYLIFASVGLELARSRTIQRAARREVTVRALALVPYPTGRAPGQRYRIEQWAPWLQSAGIELTLSPFLSSRGMDLLYAHGHIASKSLETARGYLRRIGQLLRLGSSHVGLVCRRALFLSFPH